MRVNTPSSAKVCILIGFKKNTNFFKNLFFFFCLFCENRNNLQIIPRDEESNAGLSGLQQHNNAKKKMHKTSFSLNFGLVRGRYEGKESILQLFENYI